MSILFSLKFNRQIAKIIKTGNNAPNPRPTLRDSPDETPSAKYMEIKLINHGPSVHPVSPESARTLYIGPPPFGKSFAARLKVAGHITLTLIPVNAHTRSDITGLSIKQVPR